MIKIIACDFDDTLLNSEHRISEENAAAIQKATDAGIEFLAVTGRGWNSARKVMQPVQLNCDCILACGSEVRDREGNILEQNVLDLDDVKQVLKMGAFYGAIPLITTTGDRYVVGTEKELEIFALNSVRKYHFKGTDEEIYASKAYADYKNELVRIDSVDELERSGNAIYKMVFYISEEATNRMLVQKIQEKLSLAAVTAAPTFLEVTDIRAQKGLVLKEVIEAKGYSMDEVMVLGDSMNDYSMISMDFGATVAVANAMEEVRRAARYITKTNDENGVAYAIGKMLSGELGDLRK